MLKKINEGGVESSEGFSIQIIGPEAIKYIYKNCNVTIDINYDFKTRKAYIYANKIKEWNCGCEKITINDNDKKLMIKNIAEATKLLTGDFEVI